MVPRARRLPPEARHAHHAQGPARPASREGQPAGGHADAAADEIERQQSQCGGVGVLGGDYGGEWGCD